MDAASPLQRDQPHAFSPETFEASLRHCMGRRRRRHSIILCSFHEGNVNADYIHPVPSHNRQHRSARARKPAPPYEPPAEQFTPPREVIRCAPKLSKRKKIKKPPKFNLSDVPPPSSTDDPILLHPRFPPPRPSAPTHAHGTPPLNRSALDFPLPGIPSDVEDNEDP